MMQYNITCGEQLSRLGFGTMRLPVTETGKIDQEELQRMVDYAIAHGVNYFDTAYPYMDGLSEEAIGKALAKYPRNRWFLATKYPGHQIAAAYDPQAVFEEQLKNCGVEYFDFYLLHNVYENSISVYTDARWGIMNYFREQKRLGRIRHLGMSSHAQAANLEKFINEYGQDLEFVQIQLNYLDWTLQNARQKYEMLTAKGLPVWVMESVRGGKLASLPEEQTSKLRALRPTESTASWGFRWLQGLPNVKMILSGMSNLAQMQDNVATFSGGADLSDKERELLLETAETLKNALPCTGCRYCCAGCPRGLDIPFLLSVYNDLHYQIGFNPAMQMDVLPEEKWPAACVGCGKCKRVCPQGIDVPQAMSDLTDLLAKAPKWADICKERAAAKAKLK